MNLIVLTLILLGFCVAIDYADEDVNVTSNGTVENVNLTNTTLVGGTHYVLSNGSGIAKIQNNGKIIVEKPKYPIISMWAKPSVRTNLPYKWYYRSFIDYCPHCHRYNVLLKNPKGVPEREYTCKHCGADYDAVIGKEKYSWSHYYLRRV